VDKLIEVMYRPLMMELEQLLNKYNKGGEMISNKTLIKYYCDIAKAMEFYIQDYFKDFDIEHNYIQYQRLIDAYDYVRTRIDTLNYDILQENIDDKDRYEE